MPAFRTVLRSFTCAIGAFTTMVAASACQFGKVPIGTDTPCESNADCPTGLTCVDNLCAGGTGGGTSGFGGSSVGIAVGGGGSSVGIAVGGGGSSVGIAGGSTGHGGGTSGLGGSQGVGGGTSGLGGSEGVGGGSSGLGGSQSGSGGGQSQGVGGGSSVGQTCNSSADCPTGETCVSGTCQGVCVAATCADLGFNCGAPSNGCDGVLDCGTCPGGYACVNGLCTQ